MDRPTDGTIAYCGPYREGRINNNTTKMAPSRAHTSAMADDIAKLLLINKRPVTQILPCGVQRCPYLAVTVTQS